MSNLTPQKRKSSLPLEKKLDVYEFEIDENEPKVKQKKKRGPKTAGTNKGKRVVSKKIGIKSPIKNETNKKQPTKLKSVLVSSLKNDIKNNILSTKNSSSPLFENKRRPNEGGLKDVASRKQKENINILLSEVVSVKNDVDRKVLSENISSRIVKGNKGSIKQDENKIVELDQKENFIQPISKVSPNKKTYNRKILTSRKQASNVENNTKISRVNENITISSSTPIRKAETFYNTVEVPVLFHNAQDASPVKSGKAKSGKKVSKEKLTFTAMSDDENVNKSYPENHALDHLFHSSDRSIGNKDGPSRSSFYHDSSYDCEINASTPVKYNNDTCNSSVHDCFGFDELEVFEEPLVSPIKITDDGMSVRSGDSHFTPYKTPSKTVISPEKKDEIPVKQVIRLLKFGTDDDNVESKSKSSSGSTSPMFNDVEEETRMTEDSTTINPKELDKPIPRLPRRSYERPAYLRKKNKSFEAEEDDSDEETYKKIVKPVAPKKKHGPSKKEQNEMQKWIKQFNSQCQEIEKFNLLVE